MLTFAEPHPTIAAMIKVKKKHVSYAVAPALLARPDAWLAKQKPSPSKTAAVETALQEFLDKRENAETKRRS
jgi:hypothetical protein